MHKEKAFNNAGEDIRVKQAIKNGTITEVKSMVVDLAAFNMKA